jgi:hypothetical protein
MVDGAAELVLAELLVPVTALITINAVLRHKEPRQ